MRRREFVALVGGATLVWPLATRAQQAERIWRIGVLLAHTEQDARWALFTAFKERLAQLGWVEGRNMRMDVKLTSGNAEAIAKAAGELVANSPDVIFGTNNAVTKALKNATQTIPVVFAGVSDPIGSGIVTSLTRPDQNVTGFQAGEGEIAGKWLQLLKEIAPDIRRIAFVYNPVEPVHEGWLRVAEAVAPSLGITLVQAPVSRTEDIEPALTGFASQPNGAFVVAPHAVTTAASELFIALATRLRLPAMYFLAHSPRAEALAHTVPILPRNTRAAQPMSIACCAGRRSATCRCNYLRHISLPSTSAQPGRWVFPWRRRCSPAPTR